MAKYSTGSGESGAGESCELCGAADADLQTATVAGAKLTLCSDCVQHGEESSSSSSSSRSDEPADRDRRAAQNTAKMHDAASGDSSHWEEGGVDYDDDQLPYLVADYADRITEARQDAGLQVGDLADAIDADEGDVLALEQGRATKANVGGSVVKAVEAELGVDVVDDT